MKNNHKAAKNRKSQITKTKGSPNKAEAGKKDKSVKTKKEKKHPILSITIKIAVLTFIVFAGVLYSDSKGYFDPDNGNNHTLRKWNSIYKITKSTNVDVILIGNSHLYTGINPKNLSCALGNVSFILASPGTTIIDSYYSLEEALKICKPKVVVCETYGIKSFNPYEYKDGHLSDQIKSFSARRNFISKISSMPNIFTTDNYLYAWSNTLRNHDFLYNNKEQIKKNKNKKEDRDTKLYLGRFVRFQTGLEDSTLLKYENKGAPVNGEDYEYNDYTQEYVDKIINICEENDIKLIFLTLPMYEKHIDNYDVWKSKVTQVLGKYADDNWLDMQDSAGYIGFSRHSFENKIGINQHMTYSGSLLATYKLADYILDKNIEGLPDRSNEDSWRELLYGDEGFFDNQTPNVGDQNNIILVNNNNAPDTVAVIIKELIQVKKKKYHGLIAKVKCKKEIRNELAKQNLRVFFVVKGPSGKPVQTFIDLKYDLYHSTKERLNFAQSIKPVEILQILNISFIGDQPDTVNK